MKVLSYSLLLLAAALGVFSGCAKEETPEEAAIRQQEEVKAVVRKANDLLYANEPAQALALLQQVEERYPQHPEIEEALGFAHAASDNPMEAAQHFAQSARLDGNRHYNYLYAAQERTKAGDWPGAATAYEQYLLANPNDALAWREQAKIFSRLNKPKAAIDAYLQSLKRSGDEPDAEQKAEMGRLFLQLGNVPQAETWFRDVLDDPGAEAVRPQVLVNMLQIEYGRKNWPRAIELMEQIDNEAPGVLEMTDMAFARAELERWQEDRKQREVVRIASEEAPETEAPVEAEDEGDAIEVATTPPPRGSKEDLSLDEPLETTEEAAAAAPTFELIEDGLVTNPTTPQMTPPENTDTEGVIETVPALLPEEEPPNNGIIPPTPLAEEADTPVAPAEVEATPTPPPPPPSTREMAEASIELGDLDSGIRHLRQLLVRDYQNADLWNRLAEVYFDAGEFQNAELAALQAVEQSPRSVEYRLQYLKAVQKTSPAERMMEELKRAARALPESPEVAFALATGYERIERNPRNAVYYYQRFLDLAPATHPRRPQAEAAIRNML